MVAGKSERLSETAAVDWVTTANKTHIVITFYSFSALQQALRPFDINLLFYCRRRRPPKWTNYLISGRWRADGAVCQKSVDGIQRPHWAFTLTGGWRPVPPVSKWKWSNERLALAFRRDYSGRLMGWWKCFGFFSTWVNVWMSVKYMNMNERCSRRCLHEADDGPDGHSLQNITKSQNHKKIKQISQWILWLN